ncbi:hypothetical protein PENTCL1PPCAC_28826, partial [Pristionchus entomophagus]
IQILIKASFRLSRVPLHSIIRKMASTQPVPELENPFKYETYLFDADGVLWRSNDPVPGAIKFIDELLERGKRVYIVTNNSTKTTGQYMKKVAELGFGHLNEKNIISPNVVMVDFFKRNPHFMSKAIYTIGSAGVIETLEKELGVECFGSGPDPVPTDATFLSSVDVSREVSAVVVGYDVHISYMKIMKAANYLRNPNCGFFITNEDYTFPGPYGAAIVPGTGCITSAIRACAHPRVPTVFGKPSEQLERYMKANFEIDHNTTIMFGDRLDTDIMFGNQLGVDTCWMRTGVHTAEDVQRAQDENNNDLVPQFTFSFEQFYSQ